MTLLSEIPPEHWRGRTTQNRWPGWLRQDLAYYGWFFRTFMSLVLCVAAAIVAWSTLAGDTVVTVAYPLFALISSLLLGLGLVRWGNPNVPVMLGTAVAVVGASIWLMAVLRKGLEDGTWERSVAAIFLVSLVVPAFASVFLVQLAGGFRRTRPRTFKTVAIWILSPAGVALAPILYIIMLFLVVLADLPLNYE